MLKDKGMDFDEKKMIEKSDHVRKIYGLHLFYVCLICAIITITLVCIVPKSVSDVAFQNFSFASSIVSIVLAVVSIVYSLWSGKSSNSQYDSIRHIERQIDSQLDSLKIIDKSIHNTLEARQRELNLIHEDQNKHFEQLKDISLVGQSIPENQSVDGGFDISSNPSAANVCLLSFCFSFETRKEIPRTVMDGILQKYWLGYLVGIARSMPNRIKYENKNNKLYISYVDTEYFGTCRNILDWIKNNAPEYCDEVNVIKSSYEAQ